MNAARSIQGKFTIKDNGLRCFSPPCFNICVLNEDGEEVTTVHSIVISGVELDLGRIDLRYFDEKHTFEGSVDLEDRILFVLNEIELDRSF